MKKSGIAAQSRQNETEEYIEYMVRIPKAAAEAAGYRLARQFQLSGKADRLKEAAILN